MTKRTSSACWCFVKVTVLVVSLMMITMMIRPFRSIRSRVNVTSSKRSNFAVAALQTSRIRLLYSVSQINQPLLQGSQKNILTQGRIHNEQEKKFFPSLSKSKKYGCSTLLFSSSSKIQTEEEDTYILFFHGMSRSQSGGGSSCGMAIYRYIDQHDNDGNESNPLVWWGRQYFDVTKDYTEHSIHLKGLYNGLQVASRIYNIKNIILACNNQIIIDKLSSKNNKVSKIANTKNDKNSLQAQYQRNKSFLNQNFNSYETTYIQKDYNKARSLAEKAMKTRSSNGLEPLYSYYSQQREEKTLTDKANNPSLPLSVEENETFILRFESSASSSSAGVGLVILNASTREECWHGRHYVGTNTTRYEAAYHGLILGLKCTKAFLRQNYVSSRTDNIDIILEGTELIIKQINGQNKVKSPKLKNLHTTAMTLLQQLQQFEARELSKEDKSHVHQLASEARINQDSFGCQDLLKIYQETDDQNKESTSLVDDNNNHCHEQSSNHVKDKTHQSSLSSHPQVSSAISSPTMSLNNNRENSQLPKISPDKKYTLRFDGGSRGNGSRGNAGVAGAGFVLYDENKKEIWCGRKYLGQGTNNEAEYMGIVTGLKYALAMNISNIIVEGDSQLIIRQIEGVYSVKSPNLRRYYKEVIDLRKKFESFQVRHIYRDQNSRADELANEAMDTKLSDGFGIVIES